MKKIVDANFFQDPELETYLRSDKGNIVVFTDFACMETYKGNSIKNISKSIEIVSKFTDQVIILKSTPDVIKLTLSHLGFLEIEDLSQTKGFKTFCGDVKRAVSGNKMLAAEINKKGEIASKQFDKIRKNTAKIAVAIEMLERSFQPAHLKSLRKKEGLQNDVISKIIKDILVFAAILLRDYTDIPELPRPPQLFNTYLFRVAISNYLLGLWWITEGGSGNVNEEKLKNDLIDMSYVAYATFFDGLLTKDKKMQQIYQEACFFLETLFN